jgi:hypothetical protein
MEDANMTHTHLTEHQVCLLPLWRFDYDGRDALGAIGFPFQASAPRFNRSSLV